jgi:hypothetical protein
MRARSSICPAKPYEKALRRRPMPSGLTTANRPTVGRLPQNFEFERSFAPRPCGEMTSGSGGFESGP